MSSLLSNDLIRAFSSWCLLAVRLTHPAVPERSYHLYRVPVPTLTNTEIRDLQDQLRIAEAKNQTLQNRLIEAEYINNDSDEVLADYRRQLNDAPDINRALASMQQTETPEPTPTVKIPDPEMFSGNKEKLRSFIVQLQLKTQTITDEQTRLRYMSRR